MDMRQSLFEGHVTEPRRTFAAYPVACPNVTRPPGSLHTPSLRTCGIPYMAKPPDWTVALQSQLAENVPFFSRRKAVAGRGSKQVGKQLLLYTSLHGPNPPCAFSLFAAGEISRPAFSSHTAIPRVGANRCAPLGEMWLGSDHFWRGTPPTNRVQLSSRKIASGPTPFAFLRSS